VALNIGGQRRQAVELFRAEQLAADLHAVGAGAGDKRQDGGLPAQPLTWSLPYAAVTTIIFLAIPILPT
jgi:hypothetical protein